MTARNNNNKNAKASQEPKKFCKVCQDAGKPENEYTSHWVRSSPGPEGKVICPTLLSQECKYCYKTGHTTKYCVILKKNQKNERTATYIAAKSATHTASKKPLNVFDCLYCDSSEDDDNVVDSIVDSKPSLSKESTTTATNTLMVTKVEEFPALTSSTKKSETTVTAGGGMSYATMAAKTQEDYLNEQFMMNLAKKRMMPAAEALSKPIESTIFKKNWADYSDNESDAEEEYVMPKASEMDWAQEYDSDW